MAGALTALFLPAGSAPPRVKVTLTRGRADLRLERVLVAKPITRGRRGRGVRCCVRVWGAV